jgi:enoyl-CoA hydratase/carnithine racemase
LLTTSEGKFYSNGIDLDWLFKEPKNIAERFRAGLIDLLWRIMHFPLPTVAALNGKLFVNCVF